MLSMIEENRRNHVQNAIAHVLSGRSVDGVDEIKAGYSNSMTLRIKSLKYFGSSPTPAQVKKIILMKQLSFYYYATNFIVAARSKGIPFVQESDIDIKLSSQ